MAGIKRGIHIIYIGICKYFFFIYYMLRHGHRRRAAVVKVRGRWMHAVDVISTR